MRTVIAPLRSMMALVASVVPWMKKSISPGAMPISAEQLERTLDHRLIRGLECGQHLAGPALRACLDYDVGEGAPDIDGEALVEGWD